MASAGFSALSNADFENGLVDWVVDGTVMELGGEAQLTDSQPPNTALWQGVAFPVGQLAVEFDFLDRLSADFPPGTFPDTFFASVYFANDLGSFDLASGAYDDVVHLLDLDANGIFNLNGTVGPSDKGGDWLHYAGEFQNAHVNAIMVFELFDLDGSPGDSTVRVDNVLLVIPEPGSLVLWAVGASVIAWRRMRSGWFRGRGGSL